MIDKGKQAPMPSLTTTECMDKECEKDVKVEKKDSGDRTESEKEIKKQDQTSSGNEGLYFTV